MHTFLQKIFKIIFVLIIQVNILISEYLGSTHKQESEKLKSLMNLSTQR